MTLLFATILLFSLFLFLISVEQSVYFTPLMAVSLWIIYFSFNLLINQDFIFFLNGSVFIVFALINLSIGGFVGYYFFQKYYPQQNKTKLDIKWQTAITNWHYLALLSIGLTGLGLVGLIVYSYQEYQLMNNFYSLALLPQEFSTDRYGGSQYLPLELKLLSYMIYPSALSVGALTGGKYWSAKARFIPIVLALGYGMIYSSRTVVILTLVAMISSDWAIRVFNSHPQDHKNNTKTLFLTGLSLSILLPAIFIALQWLRQGLDSEFIMNEMLQIARSSMTGSLSAFTQWFHHYDGLEFGWGRHTFAGPFELLGISNRVQGFFLEFSEVGTTHINIYTAFRGLLQDFGFAGSAFFLFIIGLVSSLLYYQVKNGSVLAIPLLAICNGWVIFSPFISLFVNNSILTGYVLFFAISYLPVRPLNRFQLLKEDLAYG